MGWWWWVVVRGLHSIIYDLSKQALDAFIRRTEDDQDAPVLPRGRPRARLHAHYGLVCSVVIRWVCVVALVGYRVGY